MGFDEEGFSKLIQSCGREGGPWWLFLPMLCFMTNTDAKSQSMQCPADIRVTDLSWYRKDWRKHQTSAVDDQRFQGELGRCDYAVFIKLSETMDSLLTGTTLLMKNATSPLI
jgi:hypothetical protein